MIKDDSPLPHPHALLTKGEEDMHNQFILGRSTTLPVISHCSELGHVVIPGDKEGWKQLPAGQPPVQLHGGGAVSVKEGRKKCMLGAW